MINFQLSAFSLQPLVLIAAFLLDSAIGDPRWLPHPVRMLGMAISRIELFLRKREIKDRFKGILLVIIIAGSTLAITWLIVHILSFATSDFLVLIVYFLLIYLTATTIAVRELINSAQAVIKAVKDNDIKTARNNLAMIVGRDTGNLTEEKILKATMESLAENLSDGVIAPVFYLILGGLPLAMAYKAINTLDSMVGYKNEKYMNFGWAAAKLDDIANYIPARISGMLIVVSTFIIDYFNSSNSSNSSNSLSALKVMLRDGRKHTSPNSGIPEAAMAGALGVKLGGPSIYGGIVIDKPYIGIESSNDYLSSSEKTITIVRFSSILFIGIAAALLYARSIL